MLQKYYYPALNVAIFFLIAIILYFIGKKQGWWAKAERGANKVPLIPGKPQPSADFDARNEAIKLLEMLNQWDIGSIDYNGMAFDAILDYSDNELISVHNAWLDEYRGRGKYLGFWTGYDTLRKQVNAERVIKRAEKEMKREVLIRLDELNL